MQINGTTKIFGLIGQNISYTLSPVIHNTAVKILDKNAVYLPFDVKENQLETLLCLAWDLGFLGFNVTQPYKNIIAKKLKTADSTSVNTIYRGPKGWEATSTDGPGFRESLSHAHLNAKDVDRWVFLGNGGATKAIVQYLLPLCPKAEFQILARSPQEWVSQEQRLKGLPLEPEALANCISHSTTKSLLVHATSAPLHGDSLDRFVSLLEKYQGTLIDINYGNHCSSLLEAYQALGRSAIDGIPMLIEQARKSQELWLGQSADYPSLEKAVRAFLHPNEGAHLPR